MSEEKYIYRRMQDEFTKKFYREIAPKIKKFDNERIKTLIKTFCFFIPMIILGIFLVIAPLFFTEKWNINDPDVIKFLTGIGITFIISAFVLYFSRQKNFENKIKTHIMPTVCNSFPKLSWVPGLYLDFTMLKNSFLLNNYDSFESDDIFKGQFKDVNFDIIESKFTSGSGKNRATIFEGVIIKLDMNKNFTGNTVIRPNTLLHSSPSPILKHTELEDINFEKKFDVFTDDEVEARYLITPSFMERLNEMKVAFKADKVSCAFYNKYLFVALQTPEDLFSICSLFKKVDDPKQFFTMFEEILSIIKLIDHFKLDQKIGL